MALQQVARVGLPARLRANFGAACGHGADFSSGRVCWGITRPPLRPALSRLAAAAAVEHGEPARSSGGDADRTGTQGGGARGAIESSADARMVDTESLTYPAFPG